MRDIDADQLTDKMRSSRSLTDDELSLISSGHSVHQRNWLLLEHVRNFERQCLLQFCKLVKEKWVEIGSQLTAGIYIYVAMPVHYIDMHVCIFIHLYVT